MIKTVCGNRTAARKTLAEHGKKWGYSMKFRNSGKTDCAEKVKVAFLENFSYNRENVSYFGPYLASWQFKLEAFFDLMILPKDSLLHRL